MTTGFDARVELKYCVPELVAGDVLGEARRYLIPEPLAQGPRQRVTSLYLDTPDLLFLRWQRERALDRHKLRIRAYGELPAATFYLETKSKREQVVRKERSLFGDAMRQAVLDYCRVRCDATPRTLVTVIRESLRATGLPTAVTVDRELRYQPATRGDLIGEPDRWHTLPLPACAGVQPVLLELKFGAEAPPWMMALRDRLAPWRISFSKYATAMAHSQRESQLPGRGPAIVADVAQTLRPAV